MQDDLSALITRVRSFPLTGERPNSRKPVSVSPDLIRAVRDAALILADHSWHKTGDIHKIAKENHVDFESLLLAIEPAQSDNDRYLCLPAENTPDKP
jgi:hypothetical protein